MNAVVASALALAVALLTPAGASAQLTPPAAPPANVRVQVNGTTSLSVTWDAVVADVGPGRSAATGYRLDFRQTIGGPVLSSIGSAATSLVVAIPPGVTGTFNVVVTATNGAGDGPPSVPSVFTIAGAGGVPGQVTNVQATVNGATLIVTFTAVGGSPTAFRLDFAAVPGGAVLASASVAGSPAVIAIPPGTAGTFYVTVTALAGAAAGPPSAPAAFTIAGGGGGGVIDGFIPVFGRNVHDVTMPASGIVEVVLTWSDPSVDLDLYLTRGPCRVNCPILARSIAVGVNVERVRYPVFAGEVFTIWVDNWSRTRSMTYRVEYRVAAADAGDPAFAADTLDVAAKPGVKAPPQ
jgi:hypothetical protein